MLPFKRNKVDISKLTPGERKVFEKYGIPARKKVQQADVERKYFDSGDYALSKAGVAPQSMVGTAIPNPENIPHASSSGNSYNNGPKPISISPTNSMSPVGKESGLANDENTIPKLFRSGEEIVVDTILKSEQPGSVKETVTGSGLANDENPILKSEQPGPVEETVTGSGLANDENPILKSEHPGSVEETVAGSNPPIDENTIPKFERHGSVEETVTGSGLANDKNPILKSEQPGSVEETVAGSSPAIDKNTIPKSERHGTVQETVIKATETTENETTGQGLAR